MTENKQRDKISSLVHDFAKQKFKEKSFIPNESVIPPLGKVLGVEELQLMVEAAKELRLKWA